MRELVFTYAADSDIQEAFCFLEDVEDGLGDRFLKSIELALEQIRAFPESCAPFRGRHRRVFTPKFPYAVFYAVYPRRLVVTGVFHLRLDNERLSRRLDS